MPVVVYVGASVDGFIARVGGGLDFLEVSDGSSGGPGLPFEELLASVDALVMGRATFDVLLGFPQWPYGELPLIVLTHRPLQVPPGHPGRIEAMAGEPAEVVRRLAGRGLRSLYVDGGRTAQAFFRAGLVDRLVVTRVPVLVGGGIPLFGPLEGDVRLRRVRTSVMAGGLVQTEYAVLRA